MKKTMLFKGQLLLEVLITIGLSTILIPVLMLSLVSSRDGRVIEVNQAQASALLKQTEEAVRGIKKSGWLNLPSNGTYYPSVSGTVWTLISGASSSGDFTRQVVISDVRRAIASGDIIPSGGYVDPSTKRFDITISWTKPHNSTLSTSFYLTRNENISLISGLSDFLAGTHVQTQATASAGGKVILGYNTKGKWCSPNFSSSTIDLPDGPPVAVAASSAASTSIPNDVFVATAPNTTSTIKLAYVNTTANTASPTATLRGKFTMDSSQYSSGTYPTILGNPPDIPNLDNSFKTNDVKYYKSASGKLYGLLATDLPSKEVVAVQINNGSGDAYQDSVNKIYKYWTFFNTQRYAGVPPVVQSYDTGLLSPSGNAVDTGGDGNGFQTNPTYAYDNDSNYASDPSSGTNTDTNCDSAGKDRHRYYNYNIATTSGAAINGIEVNLRARIDSTSGASTRKMCVELSWDGGTTWTAAKSTGNLSTSMATYTLGGSADTWGRTWSDTNFANANFRVRITDVANSTSREFRLDWAAVRVYSSTSTLSNDQAPYGYGATAMKIFENKGYILSGGFLYVFDLSNIDSKSPTGGLDQIGCRIQVEGADCKPGSPNGSWAKYTNGQSGTTYGSSGTPGHNDCSDGGNIALYADETLDLARVSSASNNLYAFVAIGGQANDELDVVKIQNVPSNLSSNTCGVSDGTDWKEVSHLDFNPNGSSEEAANSIYAKSDGSKVFMTSNGGTDSKQFYVIDTSTPSAPKFLTTSGGLPTSGFYNGEPPAPVANKELYPKRSLTVLNGLRAVLVGKDGITNGNNAQEYQVVNMDPQDGNSESAPKYCGGLDFDQGFNDLTSVSEADGDNFVYMIANTTTNELKIIQGGPDGTYLDSGNYTSPPIDIGYSTIFNRFNATFASPSNTSLDFQFAIASPSASQTCSDVAYTFTGPGGSTSAHYATSSAAIWVGSSGGYKNPARCLKYRSFLGTTNYNNTSELTRMTINYAP